MSFSAFGEPERRVCFHRVGLPVGGPFERRQSSEQLSTVPGVRGKPTVLRSGIGLDK